MDLKEIIVVISHSGMLIPREIPINTLSSNFPRLTKNVDWYTTWLYSFHDILGNSSLIFPYCSIVLEANRNPKHIDSSVPLKDSFGEPVYRANHEPSLELRRFLSRKYLIKFHQNITRALKSRTFMLDAHSTITAKGVADNQIELMNYQILPQNGEVVKFCPDSFIETYAEGLIKRLHGIKVSVNESKYYNVYGHVCGKHSINSTNRVGNRVPAILQETNHNLYMNSNMTPNLEAINTLRPAFAEALYEMMKKINRT